MSEEQVPVQQDTHPRGMPGITWAVILIAVGVVFLLNNLHINGFSINWLELIRYWPVILILVGLDVLIGRRSVFGSLAVAALALVVVGGLVWMVGFTKTSSTFGPSVKRDVTQELGDVKTARINFNLGAGETIVRPMSDSKNLVSGTYTTNRDLTLNVDYKTSGDNGVLTIRQEGKSSNPDIFSDFVGLLDLKLTDAVPVDLVVDAGVGQVTFDLTGIKLSSLKLKGGVGNVEVKLPDRGDYTVNADMGIGQLIVETPKSLEANVAFDGGISNADVPSRFKSKGESHWQTSGYEGARDRVDLTVKTGIGNFEVVDR